jgi:predicted transcriptional regulator
MKSILISIKPKYVVDILNGFKTIEIRRTMPKCDLPIDVYIYCTKDKERLVKHKLAINRIDYTLGKEFSYYDDDLNSKVVAKFTLNKVEEIHKHFEYNDWVFGTKDLDEDELLEKSCLWHSDLEKYLNLDFGYLTPKTGYAWHISNLEIFDRPRELSEFKKNNSTGNCWKCKLFGSGCSTCQLTKAPQSWCYVEVENNEQNELRSKTNKM